jgi:hypothetical protein
VADFTGTMKGPMKGADGKMIPPQQEIPYRVLHGSHMKNGEIVEERLNYDLLGMLKQIGVM